jgi:hypothetical protein
MKRIPTDELKYIAENEWIRVNAAPLAAEVLELRNQNQQLMEQLALEANKFYNELKFREQKAEERGARWMLDAIGSLVSMVRELNATEICKSARGKHGNKVSSS